MPERAFVGLLYKSATTLRGIKIPSILTKATLSDFEAILATLEVVHRNLLESYVVPGLWEREELHYALLELLKDKQQRTFFHVMVAVRSVLHMAAYLPLPTNNIQFVSEQIQNLAFEIIEIASRLEQIAGGMAE
jgi:hypothetical protein